MAKKKKEEVVTIVAEPVVTKKPKKKKEAKPTPEKIQAAAERIEDSGNEEREFNEYANDEYFDKLLFTVELVRGGFEEDTTFEMIMAMVSVLSMITSECGMPVDHLLEMVADIRDIHDNDDENHHCPHCHEAEEKKDPQAN